MSGLMVKQETAPAPRLESSDVFETPHHVPKVPDTYEPLAAKKEARGP